MSLNGQLQEPAVDKPAHADPVWVEVRCYQCSRILGNLTAYPVVDGVKNTVKFCLEEWCRHCKVMTYKTVVV